MANASNIKDLEQRVADESWSELLSEASEALRPMWDFMTQHQLRHKGNCKVLCRRIDNGQIRPISYHELYSLIQEEMIRPLVEARTRANMDKTYKAIQAMRKSLEEQKVGKTL